jgi:bacillopeptidase F
MVQNWRAANIFPVFATGNIGANGGGSVSSQANYQTDGEWTHVDLADKNIFVTGDFYLVYIQPDASSADTSPSLYSDHNSPFHDRNWFFEDSKWTHVTNPGYGNMMIRAVMNNAISEPVIETPQDNNSKID